MSINLTDEIEVKTKKGKLGAAKQIFLEGDTQTVENEIQNINSRHNDLNSKHESLSSTVSEHTNQIESNQNQIIANKSTQDAKNASLDANMAELNTRDDQITELVRGITATGGASVATTVTYDNTSSHLTSATVQGAIDELQGSKIDKTSILQKLGNAEDKVMSQKAVSNAIAVEETRAKGAEENLDNKLTDLEARMIYDVSANNGGEVFESISTLLNSSDLDTLIPISVRHGGMMIRFIQGSVPNSDNKYIQARCMAQNFTTDVTLWQGVDDKPVQRSHNLIESGGVDAAIKDTLPKNTEEDGLYICDKNGNAVIRLDILDTKRGFGENLTAAINTLIEEALPKQNTIIKDVLEEGFYICNESGKAVAKFINDKWQFLGLDATVSYQSGVATKRGNMPNGTEWVISNNSVKHDKI